MILRKIEYYVLFYTDQIVKKYMILIVTRNAIQHTSIVDSDNSSVTFILT